MTWTHMEYALRLLHENDDACVEDDDGCRHSGFPFLTTVAFAKLLTTYYPRVDLLSILLISTIHFFHWIPITFFVKSIIHHHGSPIPRYQELIDPPPGLQAQHPAILVFDGHALDVQ